jgi:heme A synthase
MKNVSRSTASQREKLVFKISIALLILSGLAQMPLFKRYYISEIPGLGWTADYHFNHVLHYLAAAVLLFIIFKWAAAFLKTKKPRPQLTTSGLIRTGLFSLIIITGFLRAVKNLQDFYFSPAATTAIIWIHLAAGLILGFMAIYSLFARKRYFKLSQE